MKCFFYLHCLSLFLITGALFSRDVLKGELLWLMEQQSTRSVFDVLITQNMINDAGGGLVITNTGTYGLAEDITFTGVNGISIDIGNVLLDLNGHALAGLGGEATGIVIENSASNVIVRNGSIINCQGVLVTDNSESINLDRLAIDVIAVAVGIAGINITPGSNNIIITNCAITNSSNQGINIQPSVANTIIENCTIYASGNGVRVNSDGTVIRQCQSFACSTGFNISFAETNLTHCLAQNCTISGFVIGGGATLYQCNAFDNTGNGFTIVNPIASLKECIARGNGGDGFSNSVVNVSVESCEAFSNTGLGFNDTTGGTPLFYNNLSYNNTGGAYSANVVAQVASTAVTTATRFYANVSG